MDNIKRISLHKRAYNWARKVRSFHESDRLTVKRIGRTNLASWTEDNATFDCVTAENDRLKETITFSLSYETLKEAVEHIENRKRG